MNASVAEGFRKEADIVSGVAGFLGRAGGALKSIGSQAMGGAAKVVGRSAAKSIGGAAGQGPRITSVIGAAKKTVGSRMLTRGLVGAGVGAGASVLRDKARGEEVSGGRAVGGAILGGAVGGALGTTMGKRLGRGVMNPVSTPTMKLRDAANPMKWWKPNAGPGISRGRSAFGNMSLLDKALTVQTVHEGAKALTSDEYQGHRAEGVLSAVGQGAAMMTGARWAGMRKGKGSAIGHLGRTTGLYLGAGIGGSMLGKAIDRRGAGGSSGGAFA